MNDQNFQEILIKEFELFFSPLISAKDDPWLLFELIRRLSWNLNAFPSEVEEQLIEAIAFLDNTLNRIRPWIDSPPSNLNELKDVLEDSRQIFLTMREIRSFLEIDNIPHEITEDFAYDLLDFLFASYLQRRLPLLYKWLDLFGVIEFHEVSEKIHNNNTIRVNTQLPKLYPDRLLKILFDPLAVIIKKYIPEGGIQTDSEAIQVAQTLFPKVTSILEEFGLESLTGIGAGPLELDQKDQDAFRQMVTMAFGSPLPDGSIGNFGVTLRILPKSSGGPGVLVAPFGVGETDSQIGNWNFNIKLSADIDAVLINEKGFEFPDDFGNTQFVASWGLEKGNFDDAALLIGSTEDTRLEIKKIGVSGEARLEESFQDFPIDLHVREGRLVVKTSEADSFLKRILGNSDVDVKFDFGLGFSFHDGFHFSGSGGLSATFQVHERVGPVTIYSLFLAVAADKEGGLDLYIGTSISAALGPVDVSIMEFGVKSLITFPNKGGNLGVANFAAPTFKNPSGVGLAVNASGITGGGFLAFNKPDYSGALQLRFEKLGLAAIGLITTGGPQGFSMLINLGVEFTPPVQLSFGFRLSAVSGLIAINRTMSTEALQASVADGSIESVMFSRDPVGNAPTLISQLKTLLPPEDGRYVVGPMLRLTWGAKNLVRADLGIFLEFPSPFKVLLLGQFEGTFPTKDQSLINVKVGILGLIDFGKKVLSIDARMYDSRILAWELSGDMAVRLSWGKDPYFIISMGGFHPRYTIPTVDPPFLSPMKRLRLELSKGTKLNLSCEAYLALSTNSLQFGARADLYVKAGPAKVEGYIGFDTLIIFSPFSFEVDIQAGVRVKVKGRNVAGVSLAFVLSGPVAWRARGKAKIKILFFKFKVRFNISWGRSNQTRNPGKDPLFDLLQVLNERESWGTVMPGGRPAIEALKPLTTIPAAAQNGGASHPPDLPLVVHPHGMLEIRQSLLPLGLRLKFYENAPVSGHDAFDITKVEIGGQTYLPHEHHSHDETETFLTLSPTQEYFARCQYFACSKKEKLSAPSFEKLDSGVVLHSQAVQIPPIESENPKENFLEKKSLEYESCIINQIRRKIPLGFRGQPVKAARTALIRGNGARRSAYRRDPGLRYGGSQSNPRVTLAQQPYQLVESTTLRPIDSGDLQTLRFRKRGEMTRAEADAALAEYEHSHPNQKGRFQVLSAVEVGV